MFLGTKRIAKTMNSTFSCRFYFVLKNRVFVSSINTFQKMSHVWQYNNPSQPNPISKLDLDEDEFTGDAVPDLDNVESKTVYFIEFPSPNNISSRCFQHCLF